MADGKRAGREHGISGRRCFIPVARLALLVCGAALAGGCSKGVKLYEVSGHIKVDHQPLQQGIIRFQPADGLGPAAEAVVTAGEYKIPTTVGHKKVSILSFKKVGQVAIGGPGGPLTDKMEQLLPPKVSDPNDTELTCDVDGGDKPMDFDVQSTAAQAK
jgi:hypothetical protein